MTDQDSPIKNGDLVRIIKCPTKVDHLDRCWFGDTKSFIEAVNEHMGNVYEARHPFYHKGSETFWIYIKEVSGFNLPMDCLEVVFSV